MTRQAGQVAIETAPESPHREGPRRMGAKPRRGRLAVLIAVVITAMVTLSVGGPAAAGPLADLARVAAPPFADVAPGAPFFDDIQWLYDQGISTGSVQPDGSVLFQPAAPVRREAMAAFLYRFAGSPAFTPPAVSPFVDVATGDPFYKEIAWLADQGISKGTAMGDGTFQFRPAESVSREAMAAFLYRFMGEPAFTPPVTSPFVDVAPGGSFYAEISWLAANGISTGTNLGDGTFAFRPTESVSREAMAAFLHRTSNLGTGNAATVSAGQDHSCAVTTTGAVMCWGANDHGQLGNNTTTGSLVPVAVYGLSSGVVAVSTGWTYSCAVTTTGAVWCWGDNQYGELGDGTTTSSTVPVAVSGLSSGAAAVSTSLQSDMGGSTGAHSCAVTTAGAVMCWGTNYSGELGNGTTTSSTVPVAVSGLSSGAAKVSVGIGFSCAVTTTGAAKCWGGNSGGTLGDGTTTDSTVPVDVSGLGTGVAAISAGFEFACAVTTTGAAKCWGWNGAGQLGDGTNTDSLVPVDVTGLGTGVAAISAGWWVACALTTGGAVKCWGNGIGSVPVGVTGLGSGAATVSTGQNFACAVTTTGAAKCWGYNTDGELGDGTTTDSIMVAVFVVGLG